MFQISYNSKSQPKETKEVKCLQLNESKTKNNPEQLIEVKLWKSQT